MKKKPHVFQVSKLRFLRSESKTTHNDEPSTVCMLEEEGETQFLCLKYLLTISLLLRFLFFFIPIYNITCMYIERCRVSVINVHKGYSF